MRPTLYGQRLVPVSITLTQEQIEYLRQKYGNLSMGLRIAVTKMMEEDHDWQDKAPKQYA